MWLDILLDNAAQVDTAIVKFIAALEQLRAVIASGDEAQLKAHLLRAREARQQWSAART
jgi:prephenate dehydrogenase